MAYAPVKTYLQQHHQTNKYPLHLDGYPEYGFAYWSDNAAVPTAHPRGRGTAGTGEVSRVPDRELRRRCAEKIRMLRVPRPFDLAKFRTELERVRRRAVELVPTTTRPNAPCGLWISMAGADYIFYDDGTEPLHQLHIICHEAGHMLFGHHGSPWNGGEITRLLMPSLDPALVHSMLGRTAYTDAEEREAETFASMILERIIPPPRPRPPMAPEAAEVLDRVESVFGGSRHGG